ncbi:MAG TPA: PEP/pyruvate-binding domain-containing protein [Candidatus Polarisedimenticolaceae bacterium]|nr:PEP/pyruvate-binding domain-containing protein [Candidatus Polarisedimenticolaceae bacterium]
MSDREKTLDGVLRLLQEGRDWWGALEMLRAERPLLRRLTRRMVNHLYYRGFPEASELLSRMTAVSDPEQQAPFEDNRPHRLAEAPDEAAIADETFRAAEAHLPAAEIVESLQHWIKEEKLDFLVDALENPHTALNDVVRAIDRYRQIGVRITELSQAAQIGLRVALVRRIFTDETDFLGVARRYLGLRDFDDLLHRIVLLPESRGKLGGKSAGLFLAYHVYRKSPDAHAAIGELRVPRTWYLPSDALLAFIRYNNLEDAHNWKYQDVEQIRRDYPQIVRVFKESRFPPELASGLGAVLDDFAERPLIVRSSSLLEDRIGAAFSGKYKSLFLANQGTRAERLAALEDAVAEVWASIFHPDPIEYRAERGLLDVHEEMAIMIQEVVGSRVGRYFLPVCAGVAFSNNDFRWSPRIRREDGLLRMVPGLGTRAVDRLSDDYPVLIAPGQPALRANVTAEEVARYAPRKLDVINLEARQFESIEARAFLREFGDELPAAALSVSLWDGEHLRRPAAAAIDFARDEAVFTFEGLVSSSPFVGRIAALLRLLKQKLGMPVDIEFAYDGREFYLLQCRPQSFSEDSTPAVIPHDVLPERVLFSARRHVSNGRVPEITHVVYVDPEAYACIADRERLREVGRAVGRLNKLLPRRRFVLMGPGRWGSRGDIKLGVNVTYSDINNTAVLIEIARQKGQYLPDLSFGTHFFQDLVEASIRYLPLYPDDPGIAFRTEFFTGSPNGLELLCPELAHLAEVVRVIDVPQATGGMILRVLLNAEQDEAIGLLAPPAARIASA